MGRCARSPPAPTSKPQFEVLRALPLKSSAQIMGREVEGGGGEGGGGGFDGETTTSLCHTSMTERLHVKSVVTHSQGRGRT